MDPVTLAAITSLWKVGGLVLLTVVFIAFAVIAVWKSSLAREKRMTDMIIADKAACERREERIVKRLAQVEDNAQIFQATVATDAIRTAATSASAIQQQVRLTEQQVRLTERTLALLEKKDIV